MSPQARDKEAMRLLEAADPAITELIRLSQHAKNENVRLSACLAILDRARIVAVHKIEVTELTEEVIDAEIERLLGVMAELVAVFGVGNWCHQTAKNDSKRHPRKKKEEIRQMREPVSRFSRIALRVIEGRLICDALSFSYS
jgi:hypothetical protein